MGNIIQGIYPVRDFVMVYTTSVALITSYLSAFSGMLYKCLKSSPENTISTGTLSHKTRCKICKICKEIFVGLAISWTRIFRFQFILADFEQKSG
jgi:hypothetical protein